MIDDKSFGGKVGVVGSGRSIYVTSLFILNIGLARSMGSELFGSFQQVFMFTVVFMVLRMGIPESIYFFLSRLNSEERSQFLGQTLVLLGFCGALVALILWTGAPALAEIQGNPGIVSSLRLFGIYGAFLIGSSFVDPVFITFKRIKYLFLLSSLHGLFFIALTIWQYFSGITVYVLFIAMSVFSLCKYVLALTLLYRMKPEIGAITFFGGRRMILLQLSFALPVALSSAVDIISIWLDKFVISIYFGPEALGIFYVGALEIPLVGVLVSSVYSVVSPILNKYHHNKDIAGFTLFVKKSLKFCAKLIWPLFAYLMFFADHIIPLVFKSGFMGSVPPFRIYLMMMPLRIALYSVIILALGKPRVVFWCAFGALIVNFVLNLVLVRQIGFLGPAIATVVSTYLQVIVLVIYILKTIKVSFNDLFPVRSFFDIGIISLISVMVAFIFTRMLGNDFRVVTTSLLIFTGLYLFLSSRAGLFAFPGIMDILQGNIHGKKTDRSDD